MIANKNVLFYKEIRHHEPLIKSSSFYKFINRDCSHGEWYNDVKKKAIYLCLNEKNRP